MLEERLCSTGKEGWIDCAKARLEGSIRRQRGEGSLWDSVAGGAAGERLAFVATSFSRRWAHTAYTSHHIPQSATQRRNALPRPSTARPSFYLLYAASQSQASRGDTHRCDIHRRLGPRPRRSRSNGGHKRNCQRARRRRGRTSLCAAQAGRCVWAGRRA